MRINYSAKVERTKKDIASKLLDRLGQHPFVVSVPFIAIGSLGLAWVFRGSLMRGKLQGFGVAVGVLAVLTVVLFLALSPLLRKLAAHEVEVPRLIEYRDDVFRWNQGDEELGRIENPNFAVYGKPVPDRVLDSQPETSWPVWFVAVGSKFVLKDSAKLDDADSFVVKTETTAKQAYQYPEVPDNVVDKTDHLFKPEQSVKLLQLARRGRG